MTTRACWAIEPYPLCLFTKKSESGSFLKITVGSFLHFYQYQSDSLIPNRFQNYSTNCNKGSYSCRWADDRIKPKTCKETLIHSPQYRYPYDERWQGRRTRKISMPTSKERECVHLDKFISLTVELPIFLM